MKGRRRTQILDSVEIDRAIKRIAFEILEKNKGPRGLVLVGIPTPGPAVARRIQKHIFNVEGVKIPSGSLDITFYRDDIDDKPKPLPKSTDMPVDISGKTVVLVDDVLYTGRTIRAAMDALMDHGRPARVQLAALVDRGHRELPIRADFVGRNIPTGKHEDVQVLLTEGGAEMDEVIIVEGEL
ncbi:MAG: bifunctional pyr operon transcriptional regulator/uracil phosphoribosyltransferase PyrR [bacterium]|nr:bifunctional pyr operon transcriptional regulator/uracil phosphoribosyltransferase PyrR [bacterium]MDT8396650.1 bifunctional pyr operon transcriptional regulator/uracil phosphoribosyltransferase PyrR [bacterium]